MTEYSYLTDRAGVLENFTFCFEKKAWYPSLRWFLVLNFCGNVCEVETFLCDRNCSNLQCRIFGIFPLIFHQL